jgi:hypothetical protein
VVLSGAAIFVAFDGAMLMGSFKCSPDFGVVLKAGLVVLSAVVSSASFFRLSLHLVRTV